MATELFEVESGFIVDDASRIAGTVDPGSAGGLPDEVGVGSIFENTSNGELWMKITAGTGTNKWARMATEQYVNDLITSGTSWREPVEVRDNVATVLPTGTATQPIVVDGISITDGERVLFSNLSGGDGKNVYIYDQASGTFSEDANNETAGDTVYVIQGTDAGKVYQFNDAGDWVLISQSSVDELGYIRAFIGKDAAGSETPVYSSALQITQNNSLEAAIGELDTALGADAVPVARTNNPIVGANAANSNIDALDEAIGADADLTPLARTVGAVTINSTVYAKFDQLDLAIGVDVTPLARTVGPTSASNDINANIDALDDAIGIDVTPVVRTTGAISASNSVNANIDALDSAIGIDITPLTRVTGQLSVSNSVNANIEALDDVVGADVDMANTNYIATTNSIYTNLSNLDGVLDKAYHEVTEKTNVTTDTLLDEVLVDSVCSVTWEVCAHGSAALDASRKYAAKVAAIHDGHNVGGGADATEPDRDTYSVRKLGASLGISLSVVLSGSGAGQTMQLRATASTASDFHIVRTEVVPH